MTHRTATRRRPRPEADGLAASRPGSRFLLAAPPPQAPVTGTGETPSTPDTARPAWPAASPALEAPGNGTKAGPRRASPHARPRTGLRGRTQALLAGALATVARSFLHSVAEHARCHAGTAPVEHLPTGERERDLARLLDVRAPTER